MLSLIGVTNQHLGRHSRPQHRKEGPVSMNRKLRRAAAAFAVGFLCIFAFTMSLNAQEFRGTVTGTVSDPNGAVIPDAVVTVKNIETGVTVTLKTNSEGAYSLPTLSPGRYNVAASLSGF